MRSQTETNNMNKEKTIFSLPRFKNVQWDINELQENSTVMSKLLKFAMFAAFALLLFGVKLWLIDFNGNITPFMDQWDAEALGLYHPYLTNTLSWEHMVAPHNEHRIFTTRLIALGLLEINNSWNPLLQMVFNAGAHILTIMMTVYLMSLVVSKKSIPALLAFSLVLFGLPYAWENTLAAFQLQFYLIVFFSVGALWLMLSAEPLGWRWWCGIALGVLAFLSLASGVFVFAVAAFVGTIIFFGNLRRTPRQLTAIAILLVLFIIGTKLTPTLEGHAGLKAASFKQFFNASIVIFGWPV